MSSIRLANRFDFGVFRFSRKREVFVKRFLCHNSNGLLLVDKKDALVDEEINIKISGLKPYAETTIRATCMTECKNNTMFQSFAHYKADSNGCIGLRRDPSLYGTYKGVEPMGLFWSKVPLENKAKTKTLLSPKEPSKPLRTKLELYDGFLDFNYTTLAETEDFCKQLNMKDSLMLNRWFMVDENVQQQQVKAGRLRGFVFYPKAAGKFQGIIDMYGSGGGIYPARAALLASRGFTTFSLPFVGYDDLPKYREPLGIEYFEEAVEWFLNHEKVKPDGIGIISLSYGVQFALLLASKDSRVKATICINGPDFIIMNPITIDGRRLNCAPVSLEKAIWNEKGHIVLHHIFSVDIHEDALIPIDKMNSKVLFLVSGDDQSFNSVVSAKRLHKRMKESGKGEQCEVILYPKAGHFIEPSYLPFCRHLYNGMLEETVAWGGTAKFHAIAQEDAWARILQFFKTYI